MRASTYNTRRSISRSVRRKTVKRGAAWADGDGVGPAIVCVDVLCSVRCSMDTYLMCVAIAGRNNPNCGMTKIIGFSWKK